MSNEAETQYNPQCGVRRTIFSDEYDFLTKIESVCAKEDGIHFLVRTWKDRIATVRITFLTPSVFRFVMVPEMTAKSHRQTVVEDVLESEFETKNAEFTENEDLYIYETNQLSPINEQISNFAQTYPTNLKASSNEALLFMRRYRFANCSCFSCCFKDAYPSSNVQ